MTILALAISAGMLAALFIGTWRLSIRKDNYSFVDVAWALAFAPTAILYACLGEGWWPRKVLVAALVLRQAALTDQNHDILIVAEMITVTHMIDISYLLLAIYIDSELILLTNLWYHYC